MVKGWRGSPIRKGSATEAGYSRPSACTPATSISWAVSLCNSPVWPSVRGGKGEGREREREGAGAYQAHDELRFARAPSHRLSAHRSRRANYRSYAQAIWHQNHTILSYYLCSPPQLAWRDACLVRDSQTRYAASRLLQGSQTRYAASRLLQGSRWCP